MYPNPSKPLEYYSPRRLRRTPGSAGAPDNGHASSPPPPTLASISPPTCTERGPQRITHHSWPSSPFSSCTHHLRGAHMPGLPCCCCGAGACGAPRPPKPPPPPPPNAPKPPPPPPAAAPKPPPPVANAPKPPAAAPWLAKAPKPLPPPVLCCANEAKALPPPAAAAPKPPKPGAAVQEGGGGRRRGATELVDGASRFTLSGLLRVHIQGHNHSAASLQVPGPPTTLFVRAHPRRQPGYTAAPNFPSALSPFLPRSKAALEGPPALAPVPAVTTTSPGAGPASQCCVHCTTQAGQKPLPTV